MKYLHFVFLFLAAFTGVAHAGAVLAREDFASVVAGRAVNIHVLGNDLYPAEGGYKAYILSQPTYGTVKEVAPGVLQYSAPSGGYAGSDRFTYMLGVTFDPAPSTPDLVTVVQVKIRQPEATTLAITGTSIPDTGSSSLPPWGAGFHSFGIPGIDDSGAPAFLATYQYWRGRRKTEKGIFAGHPLRTVAHMGGKVPDSNGVWTDSSFTDFRPPLLNSVGDLAFVANAVTASRKRQTGIWLQRTNDPLKRVVSLADEVPDARGARWKRFDSVALTDAGSVAFVGSLVPGKGGVTAATSQGLWIASESGVVTVLQRGKYVSIGGIWKRVARFSALENVPGSAGHNRMSATGAFPVRITWTDGDQTIAVCREDGTLSPKLSLRDQVSGMDGVRFKSFGPPALNRDGLLTVRAVVQSRGNALGIRNNEVIVSESAEGIFSVALREQDNLYPDIAVSPRFMRLGEPISNQDSSIALMAPVVDAADIRRPSRGRVRNAFWWRHSDEEHRFLQANSVTYKVPSYWRAFTSVAFPDTPSGQPIFTAERSVVPFGELKPERASSRGLWLATRTGEPVPLAVAGQIFPAPFGPIPIQSVNALTPVPGSPAQRRGYNGVQQVIYRLDCKDGPQLIVRQDLP